LSAANERLLELALRDGLTGLYNQTHIKELLTNEIKRAERASSCVSVLMADIDDFKQFNDTFGHPAGDEVLRELAKLVVKNTRPFDIPSRYGGEEFMIILPDTDCTKAWQVADRIRSAVAENPFEKPAFAVEPRLALSIGIATCPRDGISAKTLISSADASLYRAKRMGKNRICTSISRVS
jgi:diguanylate cyclase (GGDEF)-like protein